MIGDLSEPFNATFEGNGHTLSNLMIDYSGAFYVGLFGNTGSSATIVNLGLLDSHVQGYGSVGGLVGWNEECITNSHTMGTVLGKEEAGGLVAWNDGRITNSYATGSVVGGEDVGGLVGWNRDGSVTDSYWDVQTSGIEAGAGGVGKATAELQAPTMTTDIYSSWGSTDWDFGNPTHYPILNYAVGSDPGNPACDVLERPACGALLPHQIRFLEELVVVNGTLSPLLAYLIPATIHRSHLYRSLLLTALER